MWRQREIFCGDREFFCLEKIILYLLRVFVFLLNLRTLRDLEFSRFVICKTLKIDLAGDEELVMIRIIPRRSLV